jgi:hypothetical protein
MKKAPWSGLALTLGLLLMLAADPAHAGRDGIQPYPDSVPSWLVEGIADYTRWARYEPHHWESGPFAGVSYKDGYGWAADFLGWVERRYDRKLVQAIHAQARAGKYTNDLFRKRTKKTLDRLWAEYSEAKTASGGGRAFRLVNVRSGLALAFRGPERKAASTSASPKGGGTPEHRSSSGRNTLGAMGDDQLWSIQVAD